MAKVRCSNCEKSIIRRPDGIIRIANNCKATGEHISSSHRVAPEGEPYYQPRDCEEFLPRLEYSEQFRTLFDKAMKGLAAGKTIKDIIK